MLLNCKSSFCLCCVGSKLWITDMIQLDAAQLSCCSCLHHTNAGNGSISAHFNPLNGLQVRCTRRIRNEMLVVDSHFEIIWFTENNHVELLAGLKWKWRLSSFFWAPSTAKKTVSNHNSVIKSWVEVEGYVSSFLLVFQIHCEPRRPRSCSDVNESTGEQSSWNELLVWRG